MLRSTVWADVSPTWDVDERIGRTIDERSIISYGGYRQLNEEPYSFGFHAQRVFAILARLEMGILDNPMGDGGIDFVLPNGKTVDVKGVKYWQDPWLKLDIYDLLRADIYVLVGLDLPNRCGYIAGWATREEVLKAKIKDWSHGPRRSIQYTELHPGLPPF